MDDDGPCDSKILRLNFINPAGLQITTRSHCGGASHNHTLGIPILTFFRAPEHALERA